MRPVSIGEERKEACKCKKYICSTKVLKLAKVHLKEFSSQSVMQKETLN